MSKSKETGHDKNVTNFKALITYCAGFGAVYNPSRESLKLPSLLAVQNDAETALESVKTFKALYNHLTNERELAYDPIIHLIKRVISALDVCGASDEKVKDAKSILKHLEGTKKKKEEISATPENGSPVSSGHSTSRLSYDNHVVTLNNIIKLLLTENNYNPNEQELTVEGLQALLALLKTKTEEVNKSIVSLNNTRITRDKVLYLAENNVYELVQGIKKYIKSVFGGSSVQYKFVRKLRFTNKPMMV